jgi:hypothetical protein
MLRALVCSRVIRRIVHNIIYCMILWHQYQCALYISTRNAILWSHGVAFRRTYLEFLREASHTQLALFRTPLAVKPCSTLNVSFFGTIAVLFGL